MTVTMLRKNSKKDLVNGPIRSRPSRFRVFWTKHKLTARLRVLFVLTAIIMFVRPLRNNLVPGWPSMFRDLSTFNVSLLLSRNMLYNVLEIGLNVNILKLRPKFLFVQSLTLMLIFFCLSVSFYSRHRLRQILIIPVTVSLKNKCVL